MNLEVPLQHDRVGFVELTGERTVAYGLLAENFTFLKPKVRRDERSADDGRLTETVSRKVRTLRPLASRNGLSATFPNSTLFAKDWIIFVMSMSARCRSVVEHSISIVPGETMAGQMKRRNRNAPTLVCQLFGQTALLN